MQSNPSNREKQVPPWNKTRNREKHGKTGYGDQRMLQMFNVLAVVRLSHVFTHAKDIKGILYLYCNL